MIDGSALAAMRKHAVLINTARGAIVDTAAVAIAVRNGHLAGAGIDVLPEEPATDDDALVRLWRSDEACAERVIITPHTAYYSEQALKEIRHASADEVRRVLAGERPRHLVIQSSMS